MCRGRVGRWGIKVNLNLTDLGLYAFVDTHSQTVESLWFWYFPYCLRLAFLFLTRRAFYHLNGCSSRWGSRSTIEYAREYSILADKAASKLNFLLEKKIVAAFYGRSALTSTSCVRLRWLNSLVMLPPASWFSISHCCRMEVKTIYFQYLSWFRLSPKNVPRTIKNSLPRFVNWQSSSALASFLSKSSYFCISVWMPNAVYL